MAFRLIMAFVLLVALGACGTADESGDAAAPTEATSTSKAPAVVVTSMTTAPATTTTTFSPEIPDAEAYLLEAMDIVEAGALFSDAIEWETRRDQARSVAASATKASELHTFLRRLLRDLGDDQSFLVTSDEAEQEADINNAPPEVALVEERIGYVRVPWFFGDIDADAYAEDLQGAIAEVDQEGVCGWVVDLFAAKGGNPFPALSGIGPLLGVATEDPGDQMDGVVGHFAFENGEEIPVRYHNGVSYWNDEPYVTVSEPYTVRDPEAPIVVLMGSRTQGTGEFLAISFIGRPNTWTFGFPTAGTPAANFDWSLSDGAVMYIAAATMADRTGHVYDPSASLIPDQEGSKLDAIAWLLAQPACQ